VIAQLTGTVARKGEGTVVLAVGGVGYLVTVSEGTFHSLPMGAEATLRVHTAVREDAIELFGFGSDLEETLFHELVRVPGVGPRTAMGILSGGSPVELARMIAAGDLARLKKLPGVGKKTAERMVVDLKDRLQAFAGALPAAAPAPAPKGKAAPPADDLLLALANLGFKPGEADRLAALARDRAGLDAPLEKLVREALRAR
jgi:Holliday junction DNA helicase RuvA